MVIQQDRIISRDNIERFGYKQELRRSLGFTDLLFYGLIYIIPVAPFGFFGSVYQASGGMPVMAYLLGTVAMLFTASAYAEMVRAFPMVGSVYSYAGRGLAAPIGFVAGWMIMLDYCLVPGLLYLGAGIALHSEVGLPVVGWIVIFVIINTVINCLGIKLTAVVTRFMLIGELVVLGIFLVFGVIGLAQGRAHGSFLAPFYNPHTFNVGLVFGSVTISAMSFLGFEAISLLTEENRSGSRQVRRAIMATMPVTAVLFVVQTWVAAMFLPDANGVLHGQHTDTAFYATSRVLGGPWLGTLTAITIAIAWALPCSMAGQTANSRLLYAMARDRQLPSFLARVSPKRLVPTNAVLLTAFIALIEGAYLSTRADGLTLVTSLADFGALAAFGVLQVSVFWHYVVRKRSRRLVAHLISPLLGAVILLYVLINASREAKILGAIWFVVGTLSVTILYLAGRRPKLTDLLTLDQDV